MKYPEIIKYCINNFEKNGYEAWLVGGSVRDTLMKRPISDWDIATNAKPAEMLGIFSEAKYDNLFGTVLVPYETALDLPFISSQANIEATAKNSAINKIKEELETIEDPIHKIDHSQRVKDNALLISRTYPEINSDIMEIAAWVHDVGYSLNPKDHIAASLKFIKNELAGIFDDLVIDILVKIAKHSRPYEYAEQLILVEADFIDGIHPLRVRTAIDNNISIHLEWLENSYNKDGVYSRFKTLKGRELITKAIEIFNEQKFGISLPVFQPERKVVEITTYRSEQGYNDRRHPDDVIFEDNIEKDLERRDFTVNAMAMSIADGRIMDFFGGQKDIKEKIIRAVGEPSDRFKEDALRMLRAIRFSAQLDFSIEPKTERAISKLSGSIKFVSKERIRDELIKIFKSGNSYRAIMVMISTGLLNYIIPELLLGKGVKQNHHHIDTVLDHNLLSLKNCPSQDWRVRFSALLHDIGKPKTKELSPSGATFHNHEYAGEKMVKKIMLRLKFSNEDQEKVSTLIRNHMFYYNVGEVTESSVRKLIRKVGKENLKDLIDLRIADRLGSGTPKAMPYKLRHLQYIMDKVQNDPVSVKMLKINGDLLISELAMEPGPRIGAILDILLSEVINDPKQNVFDHLMRRSRELMNNDIESLRAQAKSEIDQKRKEDDKIIKKAHRVV